MEWWREGKALGQEQTERVCSGGDVQIKLSLDWIHTLNGM